MSSSPCRSCTNASTQWISPARSAGRSSSWRNSDRTSGLAYPPVRISPAATARRDVPERQLREPEAPLVAVRRATEQHSVRLDHEANDSSHRLSRKNSEEPTSSADDLLDRTAIRSDASRPEPLCLAVRAATEDAPVELVDPRPQVRVGEGEAPDDAGDGNAAVEARLRPNGPRPSSARDRSGSRRTGERARPNAEGQEAPQALREIASRERSRRRCSQWSHRRRARPRRQRSTQPRPRRRTPRTAADRETAPASPLSASCNAPKPLTTETHGSGREYRPAIRTSRHRQCAGLSGTAGPDRLAGAGRAPRPAAPG